MLCQCLGGRARGAWREALRLGEGLRVPKIENNNTTVYS